MRGEHAPLPLGDGGVAGIIPACAGSTAEARRLAEQALGSSPHARGAPPMCGVAGRFFRDHPRMRGEHRQACAEAGRVRGIIPACAGSTQGAPTAPGSHTGSSPHARGARHSRTSCRSRPRDHPRMRGEHACVAKRHDAPCGIIPACAGSTWVYLLWGRDGAGSSPHARGAPGCAPCCPAG